jgi:hypothetical protein
VSHTAWQAVMDDWTVAYVNSPIDLPPEATFAHAGAGGVVVWVGLVRPARAIRFLCGRTARSQGGVLHAGLGRSRRAPDDEAAIGDV